MDFSNIYLTHDIIDIIFHKLDYNDMVNFSYINSETLEKYRDTIKYKIFDYINEDYKLFYRCIRRYNYTGNDMIKLSHRAIHEIKIIWGSCMTGSYDLRYLFELIYKGADTKKIDLSGSVKLETLSMMIKAIQNSKSFNRFETIKNINDQPILRSLHYSFKPDIDKRLKRFHGNVWIYI